MWVSEAERNYHAGQEKSWEQIKARNGKKKKKTKKNRKKARALTARFRVELQDRERKCRAYLKEFWDIFNTKKLDPMGLVHMAANPG